MSATAITWSIHPAQSLASRFASHWDALNASASNLPFLSAYAIDAALSVFGTGQEQLVVAHSGERVVAMAVIERKFMAWQLFQPSQLPLGPCLLAPGLNAEVFAELLARHAPGAVMLSLTQLDPAQLSRPQDSAALRGADYIETGWVILASDFESYWSARGKNLRQNVRKQHNKLEAAGTQCVLQVIENADAMAGAIARYGALESASWKASGGTAIAADNEQGRFYLRLFEEACRRGEGRVYEYSFDGKTAAIELCVMRGDTITILKTTYDESIDRSLSPTTLLRHEQFRHLHEEGRIKRVEFFGKFMEWHGRWTENKRVLYHLTFFRWAAVKRARDWVSQLRNGAARKSTDAATTADAE